MHRKFDNNNETILDHFREIKNIMLTRLDNLMSNQTWEALGTCLGFAACLAIGVQVYSEIAHFDTPSSLSLIYIILFIIGYFFWVLYGLRFRRLAIYVCNFIALLLQVALLIIVIIKQIMI